MQLLVQQEKDFETTKVLTHFVHGELFEGSRILYLYET